jgi:hypothetical protein
MQVLLHFNEKASKHYSHSVTSKLTHDKYVDNGIIFNNLLRVKFPCNKTICRILLIYLYQYVINFNKLHIGTHCANPDKRHDINYADPSKKSKEV